MCLLYSISSFVQSNFFFSCKDYNATNYRLYLNSFYNMRRTFVDHRKQRKDYYAVTTKNCCYEHLEYTSYILMNISSNVRVSRSRHSIRFL